jgi:single-stranded DNA-binding protein
MKQILITGYIGKDAEIVATKSQKVFVKTSVAVSVGTKDKPKTDWMELLFYSDKLMTVATQHVLKGAKVMVIGFPFSEAYINKDGVAVSVEKIYVSKIEITHNFKEPSSSIQDEVVANGDESSF